MNPSRRRILQSAASAAIAMPLLSACAPRSAEPSPTRPAVATSGAATATGVYPTYLPAASGPKADFPATGPTYDDAFSSYPPNPVKALPAEPPGTGGSVRIMSIQLFPPPTVYDQNLAWQAVNKALNATVQYDIVTSADYPVKLGTIMAGNDLPDLLYMYSRPGASSTLAAAAGVPQFLQSQAADLTPYLAGDAARDYPNLAAIPTQAWKNAGCAYQGHLYMIPIHRYLPSFMWLKNSSVYDQEFGADYVPKNADDFKRVLQTLTRPNQDFYGISGAQQSMWLTQFSQLFGAPNDWRLEPGGKLTKDWETPEYREALGYVRDLFASGVYHPNSTTFASGVVARAQFAIGKFGIWLDPINGWQDAWRQALQSSQPFDIHMIPPFPAHDGGKPQHFVTGGHLWATALKKGSPERIKELLRIMNWLAAPFGSAEDQLLTFGVSGTDYTTDAKGNPTLTQQGNADANYVPWKYTIQHPFVFFTPDIPAYAQIMNAAEKAVIPVAVSNPTFGQVSQTNFTKGFSLTQTMTDGLTDIVVGRRPLSDFDQLIKDWQTNGGETIRKEYTDSIAGSA